MDLVLVFIISSWIFWFTQEYVITEAALWILSNTVFTPLIYLCTSCTRYWKWMHFWLLMWLNYEILPDLPQTSLMKANHWIFLHTNALTHSFISSSVQHPRLLQVWGRAIERWVFSDWLTYLTNGIAPFLCCSVLWKPFQWHHSSQFCHNPGLPPQPELSERREKNSPEHTREKWTEMKLQLYLNLLRGHFKAKRLVVIRVQCVLLYCGFLFLQSFAVLHQVDFYIRVCGTDE